MFTAEDMRKKLEVLDDCEGIDEWIENDLYKSFVRYCRQAIVYPTTLKEKKWTDSNFIKALEGRGFSVSCTCSPNYGDFYTITFPPKNL